MALLDTDLTVEILPSEQTEAENVKTASRIERKSRLAEKRAAKAARKAAKKNRAFQTLAEDDSVSEDSGSNAYEFGMTEKRLRMIFAKELRKREIDSCLVTIAEYECPKKMEPRQQCLEQTKVKVTNDLNSMKSGDGTDLLLKGVQLGIGILPF